MMYDAVSDLGVLQAFEPKAAVTDNTPFVSNILDCAHKTHVGLLMITGTNADADATYVVLLEESDVANMTGATAVADNDMNGTELLAQWNFADDFEPRKLGYKGSKRYIRATVTSANNTGNSFLAGLWVFKDNLGAEPNPPV